MGQHILHSMKKYISGGKRQRVALARAFNEFALFKKQVLDFAQEAEVIDPVSRKKWENADYILFYRIQERMEDMSGPRKGKGLTGQNSGVKHLKGGLENLGDPLENILRNFSHMIDAAQKNLAARTIMRDMVRGGFAKRISPAELSERRGIRGRELMEAIKEAFGTSTAFGEFTTQEKQSILALFNPPNGFVSVLSEGKPRWFTVEDPLLYRSLTNMRQQESRNNPVWKFFRGAR